MLFPSLTLPMAAACSLGILVALASHGGRRRRLVNNVESFVARAPQAAAAASDNAEGFVAPAPQAAAAVCGGGRGSSAPSKVSSLTLLRRPLPLPRPCAAAGS